MKNHGSINRKGRRIDAERAAEAQMERPSPGNTPGGTRIGHLTTNHCLFGMVVHGGRVEVDQFDSENTRTPVKNVGGQVRIKKANVNAGSSRGRSGRRRKPRD